MTTFSIDLQAVALIFMIIICLIFGGLIVWFWARMLTKQEDMSKSLTILIEKVDDKFKKIDELENRIIKIETRCLDNHTKGQAEIPTQHKEHI